MKQLALQISEIIQDYRLDDIDGLLYRTEMTPEHVIRWVNQFDENDRQFLLTELLHILPNCYFSKEIVRSFLKNGLNKISNDYGYHSINYFLSETEIIHQQGSEKSQTEMLDILNEIIFDLFNVSIKDYPKKNVKYWLYIDDVFASGNTFKKNICSQVSEFNKSNLTNFHDSNIKIIGLFLGLHDFGHSKMRFSLNKILGWDISSKIKIYYNFIIENDPTKNNSKLNFVYPTESNEGIEFLDFIESAFERNYPMTKRKIAFRNPTLPIQETFYSSSEARNRYESIMLKKGLELIYNIDYLTAKSLRPLGMVNPSYQTLGTGSHFFTWRNISNTCPIVFWWEANWYPLFPVKNRGQ